MEGVTSIMISGVGGQGSLLASKLLGAVLLSQGFDVKVSEIHGMSQRGGNVVTYVKFGKKVYSPIVDMGEADYIISFERIEAARWLSFLKKDGVIVMNDQRISPMPVITGAMEYPEDVTEKMRSKGAKVVAIDAHSMASEAGSAKAVNIVLMGVLSTLMDIPREIWLEEMEKAVPERFLELNKKAFALGEKFK